MSFSHRLRVVLLSQDPLISEGLRSIFEKWQEFELAAVFDSARFTPERLAAEQPDLVLVDHSAGIPVALLREICAIVRYGPVVLRGSSFSLEFASHAIELGVRAILPADLPLEGFRQALTVVRNGQLWFTKEMIEQVLSVTRYQLTRRESELLALLSQGLRNKEIAYRLVIGEGTVKVYLSRVFKKVGVNDRFQLALYALKNVLETPGATLSRAEDEPVQKELSPRA